MKLVLSIAGGIILAVVLLAVGCSALVASSDLDDAPNVTALSSKPTEPAPTGVSETAGQENARGSAESYLDTGSFSRKGLIRQLKFEGYSPADATYAVGAIKANWKEQAAKSAKDYLDTSNFSRSGLIRQLTFEGFTPAQAAYGVNQTGL